MDFRKVDLDFSMNCSCLSLAERAGIGPATAGFIRLLLVLKTNRNTSSILSINIFTNLKQQK